MHFKVRKEIKCQLQYFELIKRRYITFLEEEITKENQSAVEENELVTIVKKDSKNEKFYFINCTIVVGETKEAFNPKELLFVDYEDGLSCIVFYLIDKENKKVYKNNNTIFGFKQYDGLFPNDISYRRIIKKIDKIVEKEIFFKDKI